MPRCKLCGKPDAEYFLKHARIYLCRDCFIKYFERKVSKTIEKHRMLRDARVVAVAVSGGKDSMNLLKVLRKIASDVELVGLHIDLGIPGYSDESRRAAEGFCEELGIRCLVYDLKKEEGYSIPDFLETPYKKRICGVCGTVRRYLLNKIAYEIGADRLATGHNLDDTVELLFDLYLRGSIEEIVRVRPVSWSSNPKIVTRIKPLIELTDEENRYYAEAEGIPYSDAECPLARGSRMLRRKKLMDLIEEEIPGFKHTFYKTHLKRMLPRLEKAVEEPKLRECKICGMPSLGEICSYCKITSKLKEKRGNGAAGGI